MHLVEEREEGFVREGGGVVGDLEGFGVWRAMLARYAHRFIHSLKGGERRLTACSTRTNSPITRIIRIATNVADPRIQQAFPIEILAEEMFDAPETSSCYGTFLCVLGQGLGDARLGV